MHVPEIGCWPGTVVAVENCALVSLDMERARALFQDRHEATHVTVQLSVNAAQLLSRPTRRKCSQPR